MERDRNSARIRVLEVLDKTGADAASKGARNAGDLLFDVSRKLGNKWWPKETPTIPLHEPRRGPAEPGVADAHIP